MAEGRMRLDEALVDRGLASSRSRARDMILRATVHVEGHIEERPARRVSKSDEIAVSDPAAGYVSRAALKLIAGLDAFGFDPAGLSVLDLGASTGGFVQVLLDRGASHVIALDVGHGELAPALAAEPRVSVLGGLNARHLRPSDLGGRVVEAVTADLSFISLRIALPPALALVRSGAWGIFLIKPQFEVGPKLVGKGGIVRDAAVARAAADEIAAWLAVEQRWRMAGLIPSPIAGGDGNTEFLIGALKND